MARLGLGLGLNRRRRHGVRRGIRAVYFQGANPLPESASIGTAVASVAVRAPGLTVTAWALSDDAGGLFALSGADWDPNDWDPNDWSTDGETIVVNGPLDYLEASSHTVTVEATLSNLQTFSRDVLITLAEENLYVFSDGSVVALSDGSLAGY